MRRSAAGVLVLAAVTTLAGTTASVASTAGLDLSTQGSVGAGVTRVQPGQVLPFSFTVRNLSGTRTADLAVTFTVVGGADEGTGLVCPLIRNHSDINPDGDTCEVGDLAPRKKARFALVATPDGSGPLVVRACASDLGGSPDPVHRNDCRTLTVPVG